MASPTGSQQCSATRQVHLIDEAHHAVADSYRRIIDRALKRNPDCRIYGVTATPNRGDKVGLRQVFSNVADQIRLGELIASPKANHSILNKRGKMPGPRPPTAKRLLGLFRDGRGGAWRSPHAQSSVVPPWLPAR
jgi:hypothetical protein